MCNKSDVKIICKEKGHSQKHCKNNVKHCSNFNSNRVYNVLSNRFYQYQTVYITFFEKIERLCSCKISIIVGLYENFPMSNVTQTCFLLQLSNMEKS